jgi:nicotinamide-nucleotide amidase
MKIAIITIGSELLNGSRLDTNSKWIAQKVLPWNGEIVSKISIPDTDQDIINTLNYYISQSLDMIICTGGLGPTHDDITAKTLYDYFKDTPIFDDDYWYILKGEFKKRGYDISNLNKSQAYRPSIGKIIPNTIGTARGLHYKKKNTHVIVLPGVPAEMKLMMKTTVLPMIGDLSKTSTSFKMYRTTGIPESHLYEKLLPLINKYPELDVAFLPSFLGVDIRISSKINKDFDKINNQLFLIIEDYYYADNETELEEVVANLLTDTNLSIATAESCTGGLIGDRLTNVSGVSNIYKGGVIAYSNQMKINLLNVKESTISQYGAVSEQTAKEMAIGVQKKFLSDIGISTTGIAGPTGGTNKKPIGLVYIGFHYKKITKVYKFNFRLDRKSNKMITSQAALNIIRKHLL